MYYAWTGWWWWFCSVIPFMIIAWMLFGWSDRRYRRYRDARSLRDDDWDDWSYRARPSGKYRGRAPRNYQRSDVRIAEDVNDRLMLHDDIDPSDLEVRVENGTVHLSGTVESRFEKRLAERIADAVAGVVDVDNRVQIGKPGRRDDLRPAQQALPH